MSSSTEMYGGCALMHFLKFPIGLLLLLTAESSQTIHSNTGCNIIVPCLGLLNV